MLYPQHRLHAWPWQKGAVRYVCTGIAQVVDIVGEQLLDVLGTQGGGLLGEHSWV